MKKQSILFGTLAISAFGFGVAATIEGWAKIPTHVPGWLTGRSKYILHNGWGLSPAGTEIDMPGDMPGNIVVLPATNRAIVTTCGFHDHSINLIDLETRKILDTKKEKNLWVGLAKFADGRYLVSLGKVKDGEPAIRIYEVHKDSLDVSGKIVLPTLGGKERFISSILPLPDGTFLAADIQNDMILKLNQAGELEGSTQTAYRPYQMALSPDEQSIAVTNWGDESVSLYNASDLTEIKKLKVGKLPSSVAYAPDGRLFVSNSGGDTVSVIANKEIIETIRVGITRKGIGSTPTGLSLGADNKLYVALSGENALAMVDVSKAGASKVLGYLPTGKYPVLVQNAPDGKSLLVATGKGYYGPNSPRKVARTTRKDEGPTPYLYIGDQLQGHLAFLPIPNSQSLKQMTDQVAKNLPMDRSGLTAEQRAPIEGIWKEKIDHVVYIIRENRTYDQVFGDIPSGNGDPNLAIFGAKVTPNSHKLVSQFVLFDNLYTDGEVSQSGHQWTDAAYANDYCEHQWLLNYGRHGEVSSDPRLTSSPGEYIWSQARKFGKTARVYGEYVDRQEDHDSANAELAKDVEKYGYSADYEKIFARGGRDTELADSFLGELEAAEKSGNWPNLMVMALPEDHTHGFSPGAFSPHAMIASNDQAIGKIVDRISRSRFWSNTAIFIIQDDAQAGPDHVDSHRTVGLVLSPYTRRGGVIDSTMYSTASMLRTIEMMLELPPMTAYDALATPMYNAFTLTPDLSPYDIEPAKVDLQERNPQKGTLAARSKKLDFSSVDRADPVELNRILWEAYKPGQPYPAFAPQK